MFKRLREEIDTVLARDPAARSRLEVVLCYPGFHAVLIHRLSHILWTGGWHLAARFLSHVARFLTGIEIHPGARIGRNFFIDHGMGVVIGETAEIGDNVHLYHQVTLGGTSLAKGKRHPTIQDNVIIGAGAKVLGAITVGEGARIGANAVVVGDVTQGQTIVGVPGKPIVPRDQLNQDFLAYGTPCGDLPDPVARAMSGLLDRVHELSHRVEELEHQIKSTSAEAPLTLDRTTENGRSHQKSVGTGY